MPAIHFLCGPSIYYVHNNKGRDQVFYTIPLHITCKGGGGEGGQIAYRNV